MDMGQLMKHLARQRVALGKTQPELAKALGISRAALSQMETGRIEPSRDTLTKLADALGVTVAWDTVTGYRIEAKNGE